MHTIRVCDDDNVKGSYANAAEKGFWERTMHNAGNYWITIVELKTFTADADDVFTDKQREELSDFIAVNPHFGDVIPGTGGVRKLRWAAGSKGKRGGARVIYYFRDLNMPVFLLAVYKKGEKIDLTMADREAMQQFVNDLVSEYSNRRKLRTAFDRGKA